MSPSCVGMDEEIEFERRLKYEAISDMKASREDGENIELLTPRHKSRINPCWLLWRRPL